MHYNVVILHHQIGDENWPENQEKEVGDNINEPEMARKDCKTTWLVTSDSRLLCILEWWSE